MPFRYSIEPSLFEYFLFAHLVLIGLFWPIVILALHRSLPWTLGRESAAAWAGRRGYKLLAGVFGVAVVVCGLCHFFSSPSRFVDGALGVNAVRFSEWYQQSPINADSAMGRTVKIAAFELAMALTLLMGFKLFENASHRRGRPGETAAGWRGVRAWLGMPNVLWAMAWTACVVGTMAWFDKRADADDVAVWSGLVLLTALGVLLATPLLRTLRAAADQDAAPTPVDRPFVGADLSPERQRVMRLLEDGAKCRRRAWWRRSESFDLYSGGVACEAAKRRVATFSDVGASAFNFSTRFAHVR